MNDSIYPYAEELLARANAGNVPSGILHWSLLQPYRIAAFDGDEWRGECDQSLWMQLYHELHQGNKRETAAFLSWSDVIDSLAPLHDRHEVPIAIACHRYDTPKRTFVGKVLNAARKGEPLPQPESAERILETKTAFFASALLRPYSDGFDFLPYEHHSLDATFVVPRRLFLTNLDGAPSNLEIDFDDGEGFRSVAFDERVSIRYADDLPKRLRLRLSFDGRTLGATFGFRVRPIEVPEHTVWELGSADVPSYDGEPAKGWAWVFPRTDQDTDGITSPMIFGDGFGQGPSDLDRFLERLNKEGMATKLRQRGKDVILVGYGERSESIRAHAMVVVALIEKIKRESPGKKIVVAGASMGGLVARYALLYMESKGEDHATSTYLSYDTPHEGAWIPIAVQKFVHYFESNSVTAAQKSKLIRSPAARQMLWAWTDTKQYIEGEKFRENSGRANFIAELTALTGQPWPKVPFKYAVANGTGDGTGNGVLPNVRVIQWDGGCAGAWLWTQQSGDNKQIGGFRAAGDTPNYYTKDIPEFDGAPGGTSDSFGQIADGIRAQFPNDNPNEKHRIHCFIPTFSAVAAPQKYMAFPRRSLAEVPRNEIPFTDYVVSAKNTEHVDVTPELCKAVVDWCAPVG